MNARHLIEASFEADLDKYYNWRPKPGDFVELRAAAPVRGAVHWLRKAGVPWRVNSFAAGNWVNLERSEGGKRALVMVNIDDIIGSTEKHKATG